MNKGFMLTMVSCVNCNQGIGVQPPAFAFTEDLIWAQAEIVHKSTQLICANPRLIAVYVLAMVSDGFGEPEKEPEEEFPSIITGV